MNYNRVIKTVAVVGAGVMGSGIVQVAAMHHYDVYMRDVSTEILNQALKNIRESLARFVKKEKITSAESEQVLKRIKSTVDLGEAVNRADIVIEAVPERLEMKQKVFQEIDKLAPPNTIITSNTSQYSITLLGASTARPDKVIGTHWFVPPVMMRLIEVVVGLKTSEETVSIVLDFAKSVEKETVICKDSQGFITSRVNMAFFNECFKIFEESLATMQDIDKAVRLGLGHAMGPFEISDLSGCDTVMYTLEALDKAFGERFKPPQSLIKLVNAGLLGRKAGKGFFDYMSKEKK